MGEIRMTRDFFLWCMSVIYLCAFASLFVQIPGLYGDNGILPARLVVQKEAQTFADLLTEQPTLLRLLPKVGLDVETGMDFLCLGGVILSFVAMVARHQRNTIVFAVLWMFYLSLFQFGQTFLWFQWDILLLEAGFLTILIAPLNLFGWRSVSYHQHDRITFWLLKWLLFRLMFASGVVKLTSNCPTWWGLTAMNWHYESQCIPTPLAWFFAQLPEWFHKLSVVITYIIEIAFPLLYFSPVRAHRILAFYGQILLMGMIMLTGNYNFFNLLTIALSLCLIDDSYIMKLLGKKEIEEKDDAESYPVIGKVWRPVRWALNFIVYGGVLYWTHRLCDFSFSLKPLNMDIKLAFTSRDLDRFLHVVVPISMYIGVISLGIEIVKAGLRSLTRERGFVKKLLNLLGTMVFGSVAVYMFSISLVPHTMVERNVQRQLPGVVRQWHAQAKVYTLTSPYGLFRRMTGVGGRPEVIIEGSNDMKQWKEYHFMYKPGKLDDAPAIVAPHQPRLDWQMWFAALGTYEHNPWFLNLVFRLMTNEPEVVALLEENPFPKEPPKYMRATLYHYHFTRWDKDHPWHSTINWWVREKQRDYLPIIRKNEPSFVKYLKDSGIYKNTSKKDMRPSYLRTAIAMFRRILGTLEGMRTILALLAVGLTLTFFDPTIRFLRSEFR